MEIDKDQEEKKLTKGVRIITQKRHMKMTERNGSYERLKGENARKN